MSEKKSSIINLSTIRPWVTFPLRKEPDCTFSWLAMRIPKWIDVHNECNWSLHHSLSQNTFSLARKFNPIKSLCRFMLSSWSLVFIITVRCTDEWICQMEFCYICIAAIGVTAAIFLVFSRASREWKHKLGYKEWHWKQPSLGGKLSLRLQYHLRVTPNFLMQPHVKLCSFLAPTAYHWLAAGRECENLQKDDIIYISHTKHTHGCYFQWYPCDRT